MPLISLGDVAIYSGIVEKLPVSMRTLGLWRKRFMVLRRGKIDWFDDQAHAETVFSEELDLTAAERPSRGTLLLDGGAVLDKGTAGCLAVRTSTGTLWIRASKEELDKWARVIESTFAELRPRVLYTDSFVEINAHAIIIRHYFFPTLAAKVLPLSSVTGVDLRPEQRRTGAKDMGWGIGLGVSKVWWARDQRLTRANGAIILRSDTSFFAHGFSCDDRGSFVDALKRVMAQERQDGGGPVEWLGDGSEQAGPTSPGSDVLSPL